MGGKERRGGGGGGGEGEMGEDKCQKCGEL